MFAWTSSVALLEIVVSLLVVASATPNALGLVTIVVPLDSK